MKQKIIKIGLDLDGVILYNPIRIARPIIALLKKIIKRKKLKFYIPKTKLERQLWKIFHKSSLFIVPEFYSISKLAKLKKIELYIITARYSFLKKDFFKFLEKSKSKKYLSGYYFNQKDDQPHLYKEKIIKKLNLDYFIEDNWDIVNYLTKNNKKTKIFWLYNILDKKINYPYKYPSLKEAFAAIFDK